MSRLEIGSRESKSEIGFEDRDRRSSSELGARRRSSEELGGARRSSAELGGARRRSSAELGGGARRSSAELGGGARSSAELGGRSGVAGVAGGRSGVLGGRSGVRGGRIWGPAAGLARGPENPDFLEKMGSGGPKNRVFSAPEIPEFPDFANSGKIAPGCRWGFHRFCS